MVGYDAIQIQKYVGFEFPSRLTIRACGWELVERSQGVKHFVEGVLNRKFVPTQDEGKHPCKREFALARPIGFRHPEALHSLWCLDRLFQRPDERFFFFSTFIASSFSCVFTLPYHNSCLHPLNLMPLAFMGNVGLLGSALLFLAIPQPWPLSLNDWITARLLKGRREQPVVTVTDMEQRTHTIV
jgi:hypothetical protein